MHMCWKWKRGPPGLGGSITWCDSGALEEKQTDRDGWKEMETETYHGGERELNLNEKAWKMLKKYKHFSAFQKIFYHLRNIEELNTQIKKNKTTDGGK